MKRYKKPTTQIEESRIRYSLLISSDNAKFEIDGGDGGNVAEARKRVTTMKEEPLFSF